MATEHKMAKAPEWDNVCSSDTEMPCTCHATPAVADLEGAPDALDESRATLVHNLQTFGWSPLRIACSDAPPPTQSKILNVFHEFKVQNHDASHDDLAYIAAESGSTQGSIEPKESLEVALNKCNSEHIGEDVDIDSSPETQVKQWCRSLSWIAHKVCEVLELPSDTFLPSCPEDSLDLLRVFHYYALDNVQNGHQADDKELVLGSSPHTDWGSLTIVWQDHVGGLQTYCRNCHKWVNVPPLTDMHEKCWQVIVHVGDMASVVLNALGSDDPQQSVSSLWPSPKHRVASSKTQDRVSLVYFAYPPSQTSLASMHDTLTQKWKKQNDNQSNKSYRRLPLKEYYLLHDQSVGSDVAAKSPEYIYKELWSLSVEEIVQHKWKQVNRG